MHYNSCIQKHVIDFMSIFLDRHTDNLYVPDQPFPCIARYHETFVETVLGQISSEVELAI